KAGSGEEKDPQRVWLREQQSALLNTIKENEAAREEQKKQALADAPSRPKEIYIDDKSVSEVKLSPDERFVTYKLVNRPKNAKVAIVPNYVTASGYTEDINTRTKVGDARMGSEFYVYNIQKD